MANKTNLKTYLLMAVILLGMVGTAFAGWPGSRLVAIGMFCRNGMFVRACRCGNYAVCRF